jgi:hypothetical protein
VPDPAIFVVGAIVTFVTVMACRAVGRAEEQDARDQERERSVTASKDGRRGSS